MTGKLLSLTSVVTRCLLHQNSVKLRILDSGISSKCWRTFSDISSISKLETKPITKKKKKSSKKQQSSKILQGDKTTSAKSRNLSELNEDHVFPSKGISVSSSEKLSESINNDFSDISDSSVGAGNFKINIEEKNTKKLKVLMKKFDEENSNDNSIKIIDTELQKERKESQKNSRIESFNNSLASYISASMFCGHFKLAYDTYKYYKQFDRNTFSCKVFNLITYNEVLKGIANQGDVKMMMEVLNDLINSSQKPDYNTIAYCIICLGRNKSMPDIVSKIKDILNLMDQHEITLDEVFGNAAFPGNSLQLCMETIEMVMPKFMIECEILNPMKDFIVKQNCYNNNLVNDLNETMFKKQVKSPADGILTQEELSKLIQDQINLELKGYIEIPTISKNISTEKNEEQKNLLNEWKGHWRKILHKRVTDHKKFMTDNLSHMKGRPMNLFPYFDLMDTEDIVDLLMLEVNNLCLVSKVYSSSYTSLARDLGKEFFKRFQIRYREKTHILPALTEVYEDYCHWYLNRSDPDASYIPRIEWKNIQSKMIHQTNFKDTCMEWPYTIKLGIGKVLYNLIFTSVMIWEHGETEKACSPAFYKVHRFQNSRTVEEIRPSPLLTEVLEGAKGNSMTLTLSTTMLPMISPPIPWIDLKSGGYILTESDFIRVLPHVHQQKRTMEKMGMQKLYPVMDSLTSLALTPWRINCNVLDIIIQVFNNGGWEEVDITPPPSSVSDPPKISNILGLEEKRQSIVVGQQLRKKKAELNSIWCDTLYKLSLANYYRDSIIWLPHNMDFRGRTYPVPPHLTHVSSDTFRSILCFAQGKKLGKEGLYWLKLHIVNLSGKMKKCKIEERLKFCEEIMDEIFDSAKNPLNGNKWWTKSDEPWQTLAACKDLVAALESESPEEYVSHIPIHQDGSCNGLQHYAALGRDKEGAASVNLRPSDRPQDVYSCIVDIVEESRKKDAETDYMLAKELKGFITRKIIKQTVMTTVYGVTRYGARLQILKQLKELDDFPQDLQFQASSYLTKKTFESIGSLFIATKEIQDWLVKMAEGISKNCLQNVEWETPLGFPVVQPYSKQPNTRHTPGDIIKSYNLDYVSTPNVRKQKNGFPPNFIHSLDASHMMLTSLYCQLAGITFVSVHDCFWTHASTVPIMNKICREEFVKLHSEPILHNLAKFMIEKYSSFPGYHSSYGSTQGNKMGHISLEDILQDVPATGDFDINEILRSVFFFS